MGGIAEVGLSVTCDRNGKTENVTDKEQVDFYKKYASEKTKDDMMFACVLKMPNGEVRKLSYEYLCPSSANAIAGYLDKIDPEQKKKPKAKAKAEPILKAQLDRKE